ncbi:MAG: hypothetical protein HQL69_23300 [Magnetococcales bacterium]|nr:hypothetical protein [Magnetococcales bacterium]
MAASSDVQGLDYPPSDSTRANQFGPRSMRENFRGPSDPVFPPYKRESEDAIYDAWLKMIKKRREKQKEAEE